jgi:hypothetical protein
MSDVRKPRLQIFLLGGKINEAFTRLASNSNIRIIASMFSVQHFLPLLIPLTRIALADFVKSNNRKLWLFLRYFSKKFKMSVDNVVEGIALYVLYLFLQQTGRISLSTYTNALKKLNLHLEEFFNDLCEMGFNISKRHVRNLIRRFKPFNPGCNTNLGDLLHLYRNNIDRNRKEKTTLFKS